jgi:hypothetical protein
MLRRCQAYQVVTGMPSVLRGAVRASGWTDATIANASLVGPSDPSSSDQESPLRSYFDSLTRGPGIWKWTHYFDIYHRYFREFVGKEVHIVEVGIYSGGSLDMWKAYFGEKCKVYGVDIEAACKNYEDERTRVFIGDQSDRKFWQEFRDQVPRVDILVDDGGHQPEQQIVTLEEVLPHMRPGGVYLCEDVHGEHNRFTSYLYGLSQALNATARNPGSETVLPSAFQKEISSIHQYPFVTVIEKTRRPVTQFVAPKRGTEWQPFL